MDAEIDAIGVVNGALQKFREDTASEDWCRRLRNNILTVNDTDTDAGAVACRGLRRVLDKRV